MTKTSECDHFSARLIEALEKAGYSTIAAAVCREFNIRYPHGPVTVHTVRNWLTGVCFPSREKLLVLATWLDVSPNRLRFGRQLELLAAVSTQADFSIESIVRDLQSLDADYLIAAQEMIRVLVKLNTSSRRQMP